MEAPSSHATEALGARAVLLSIVGFWLFYAALMTMRSLLINPWAMQAGLLGLRLVVTAAGAALTLFLWAALRLLDRKSMPARMAAAAVGCGINAALFAILNAGLYLGGAMCTRMSAAMGSNRPMIAEPVCNEHWRQLVAEHLVTGYFLMATWAALYLALGYAARVGGLERRGAELRAAAQAAELRALRYQVNPHFLFNTLNALSSLVLANRGVAAERMIGDLATYYRTTLAFDPERDVTLEEEFEMQRLYLSIEATRFPERLSAVFDLPTKLATARVPGMVLQPLVENAVKHGVSRSRERVTIRISAAACIDGRLVVKVEDDATPSAATAPPAGMGLGLRNVSDRLAARHGGLASARWGRPDGAGFSVTLELPLVRDAG